MPDSTSATPPNDRRRNQTPRSTRPTDPRIPPRRRMNPHFETLQGGPLPLYSKKRSLGRALACEGFRSEPTGGPAAPRSGDRGIRRLAADRARLAKRPADAVPHVPPFAVSHSEREHPRAADDVVPEAKTLLVDLLLQHRPSSCRATRTLITRPSSAKRPSTPSALKEERHATFWYVTRQ
jgi:hypothetical protein